MGFQKIVPNKYPQDSHKSPKNIYTVPGYHTKDT